MAIPQPQTGSSLPGRSPAQPPRPLGQAPSGEKDLTKDLGLPEAAPKSYERPALRSLEGALPKKPDSPADGAAEAPASLPSPSFKARPSLTERPTKPAAPRAKEEADGHDSDEDEEWGLPAASPATSKTRYVALAVVALAVAGGGYVGYTRYWPKSGAAAEETEVASSEKDETNAANSAEGDGAQSEDPFDSFGEGKPQKLASNQQPRIARHTPDAEPISGAESSRARIRPAKKNSAATEMDLPLELPSDEDETSEVATMQQDEPEDELESESDLPLLASPKASQRSLAAVPANSTKHSIGSLSTSENADSSDPYTIDEDRRGMSTGKKGISIVEVNDEEEQETPAGPTPQRAVSKTVVVRSTAATAPTTPGPSDEDEEDNWTVDETPRTTRKPAVDLTDDHIADDDAEVSAIRPKGTVAGTARRAGTGIGIESSSRNGVARTPAGGSPSAPKGELYTIAPNDNFWTISRRQYGSGRYFAALAKHNQDRVSDPQRLRPGMQISTPPAATLDASYPDLIDKSGAAVTPAAPRASSSIAGDGRPLFAHPSHTPPASEPSASSMQQVGYFYSKSGEPMYRVGGDDTLGSIAQKHLGRASRWTEIYEQNRAILKNPENLTVGTVIRLPPDASKVGWLDSEPKQRR